MSVDRPSTPIDTAIAASFLASLSPPARDKLIDSGRVMRLPPGHLLVDGYRDFGGVVVSGLLRVFAEEDATGPSITYRNAATGEAVGLGALLGVRGETWVQTVTASTVLSLDLVVVADLRSRDPVLALALAHEAIRRLQDISRELKVWVRGSVRQRTIRRLLDLAAEEASEEPISIAISHERLAESIGSRREVVTRALGQLEKRGLVRLGHGRIYILDLLGLRSAIEQP